MEHSGHMQHGAGASTSTSTYNVNLQLDPARPVAREPVSLSLAVTEQAIGEPLAAFDLLHEKPLHLIAVSADLAHFDHVHPELRDGAFRIQHAFPVAGGFKLWAECKPSGGDSVLAAFRVDVAPGTEAAAAPSSTSEPYRVTLDRPPHIILHKPSLLAFRVETQDGRAVEDLEPLMGAGGHCVIISEDLRRFLHVHPERDVDAGWRGGPEVRFSTAFHEPGSYKAWGQFQHKGRTIVGAFDLQVGDAGHAHSGDA